MQLMTTDCIFR